MRGVVTPEVIERAKEFFPNGINTLQLRLMPYVSYIAQNNKTIELDRINLEEKSEIDEWVSKDWIVKPFERIEIRKDFWDLMQDLIYISYVRIEEDEKKKIKNN